MPAIWLPVCLPSRSGSLAKVVGHTEGKTDSSMCQANQTTATWMTISLQVLMATRTQEFWEQQWSTNHQTCFQSRPISITEGRNHCGKWGVPSSIPLATSANHLPRQVLRPWEGQDLLPPQLSITQDHCFCFQKSPQSHYLEKQCSWRTDQLPNRAGKAGQLNQ